MSLIKYSLQVDVNGPNTAPVYNFLKSSKGTGLFGDIIKWNFEKFLIDKDGKVVERYLPTTSPLQIEASRFSNRCIGGLICVNMDWKQAYDL